MRVRLVGRGRAGRALAAALQRIGRDADLVPGQSESGTRIASADVDLVVLCVPDDAISHVAGRVERSDAVVAHCAGSRGLDELGDHPRVGSIHPLRSLPADATSVDALLDGCTYAVAGDPLMGELVDLLGGRAIEVPDEARAEYHAAACVAANHLVVLCAQVERLAGRIGVPAEPYWEMMRRVLDNVERHGSVASLTGPAARGDVRTIAAHIEALPAAERGLYSDLAEAAADLAASGTDI